MPNTKNEWLVNKPLDGEVLDPTPTDNVAAKLESDLQEERDSRKEERFYWIMALVIIGNFAQAGTARAIQEARGVTGHIL